MQYAASNKAFSVVYQTGMTEQLVNRIYPLSCRSVVVCDPVDAALVVGSSQNEVEIRSSLSNNINYNVVKRRSGGGAVLVLPGKQIWIDVFIPKEDPLYVEDILEAPLWLGQLWSKTINSVYNKDNTEVYRGRLIGSLSKLICFSGLGPGEVLLEGQKIVGISQRRIRSGTWFYTMLDLYDTQLQLYDLLNIRSSVKTLQENNKMLLASKKHHNLQNTFEQAITDNLRYKDMFEKTFLSFFCEL